jgi:glycosyltransferase involved in cell wall biosynthesis
MSSKDLSKKRPSRKARNADRPAAAVPHPAEQKRLLVKDHRAMAPATPSVRDCVIVAGMYRSGGYTLMRALNLLGVSMGDRARVDESGGLENPDVAAANERILKRVDIAWNSVEKFPANWFGSAGAAEVDRYVAALIENNFEGQFLFGFRDPRVSRTLPVWLSRLAKFGVRPLCVQIVRNPLDVAASLKKRDGMSSARSLMLWLRYNADSELHSRGANRVFVAYEDLMNDWRSVVQRVARTLNVVWPVNALRFGDDMDAFISARIPHHATPDTHLYDREDVSELVKMAYEALSRLTENPEDADARGALDLVRDELDKSDDAFNAVIADYETELRIRADESERFKAEELGKIAERLLSLHASTGAASGSDAARLASQGAAGISRLINETASRLEAQRAGQEENVAALLASVQKSGAALEEALRDKGLLQTELDRARAIANEIEAQLGEARQTALELDSARQALKSIVADYAERLPFEQTEFLFLQNEPFAIGTIIDQLKADIGAAARAMEEHRRKADEAAEELTQSRIENSTLVDKLERERAASAAFRNQSEVQAKSLADQLEKLRGSATILETRLLDSQRENEREQERHRELTSLFRTEQQRLSEIEARWHMAREEVSALATALEVAKLNEANQREQAGKCSTTLEETRAALGGAVESIAQIEEQKRDVETTVASLRQEIEGLKGSGERLEAQRNELQRELAATRAAEQRLTGEVARLQGDVEALQSVRQQIELERLQLRGEMQNLLAVERQRAVETESRCQAAQEEARALAQALEAAQSEQATEREKAERLENALAERMRQIAIAEGRIAVADLERLSFQAESVRLRQEVEEIRSASAQARAIEPDRRAIVAKALAAKREASQKAKQLEKMLRAAEDRKAILERARRARGLSRAALAADAQRDYLARREAKLSEAREKALELASQDHKRVGDTAWSTQLRLRLAGTGLLRRKATPVSARGLEIMRAGLFDADYYRSKAGALLPPQVDPLQHYLHVGWTKHIDPHPLFSVRFYIDRNPDVAEAGVEPLDHYLTFGSKEGRSPHPLFSARTYRARRGELPDDETSMLEDYLESDANGVDPHPLFDHRWYAERAGLGTGGSAAALLHYLTEGWTSGAPLSPLFDSNFYLEQLDATDGLGMEPYSHFALFGAQAGLDPHPLFDTENYLAARDTVDPFPIDPLLDYLESGEAEGLTPNPLFDPAFYRTWNSDAVKERRGALWHYVTKGAAANAQPHPLFDVNFVAKKRKSAAPGQTLLGWFLQEAMPKFDAPSPLIDVGHYASEVAGDLNGTHPLVHFLTATVEEIGDPHPLFNVGYYLSQIPTGTPTHRNPLVDFVDKVPTKKLISPSPYFDSRYYVETYSDVKRAGMNPLKHYLLFGVGEGRRPRADLDMEGYRRQVGLDKKANPLLHYVKAQQSVGAVQPAAQKAIVPPGALDERELKTFPGRRPRDANARTILVVAHMVGKYLFGGERSFLDILEGFASIGVNVVAALPTHVAEYTEAVRDVSCEVVVFNYGWWRNNPISEDTIDVFEDIILGKCVDAVHANTIVLREPVIAAANCGVPGVIHVRELIQHDEALSTVIGSSPRDIVEQTLDRADWIIANSQATARAFDKPGRTFVVPNTIDMAALDMPNPVDPQEIRFGIVSSNVPKKGINDVVALARACEFVMPMARFMVIGPETQLTKDIQEEQEKGVAPSNLIIAGYANSPRAAMEKVNVVINFSHFAESFGRTVLEAMAARRPVIAYEWGAIPELVQPGVTGELVPYAQPLYAISAMQKICENPDLIAKMGEAGRAAAVSRYSKERYARLLAEAYDAIFDPAKALATPSGDAPAAKVDAPPQKAPALPDASALPAPPGARVLRAPAFQTAPNWDEKPRIAYFCWHFPVPSETFVLSELRHLVAQGYDVLVFCRQIPYKDFKPDFPIVWRQVKSPQQLADALIETGRTVAHGHFVYPTVTNFLWPACEAANVPFTFIAHAQDIFRHSNDEKNRIGEICRSPLCLRLFVLSRFHRNYVIARGVPPEKIVINPNSVDTARMTAGDIPSRSDRAFRAVCAVHRFSEKKGLENLIRAGKELARDGVSIDLYGYGELEDRFRELIEEQGLTNVRLCGRVHNYNELCDVLRRYDLFVCPSVRTADGDMDGIPTSAIEAMAAGMPVLTTAISGIPDLVTDGLTGLVCEATPRDIAAAIRRYYAMPPGQVEAIIKAARHKASTRHDINRICRVLLRVWERKTIDIIIVSWTHLEEHRAVIERLYEHTSLPFHLIVCANSNDEHVVALLENYHREKDNFTVIHSGYNAFVGPGTNYAMNQGWSDIAIYVCGKEGFVFRSGWEIPFIHTMAENPEFGLAGTLCHAPTYLTGSQYPSGIKEFDNFRNRHFAAENPDRIFSHVQGGFFAIRRKMYEEIGGFSEATPHSYTDVEYSYYVESMGWKLGEVEGLMALFNKSRPPLAARIDETIGAAHPPELSDLDTFGAITRGERFNCNVCCWNGDAFVADGGDMLCPSCNAGMADRSLFRWLAPSVYLYRRLPAVAVGLAGEIEKFWAQQFQGPRLDHATFLERVQSTGRLQNRDRSLEIGFIRGLPTDRELRSKIFKEFARLLKPGGKLVLQTGFGASSRPHQLPPEIDQLAVAEGFSILQPALYFSHSMQLDWAPLFVFARRDGAKMRVQEKNALEVERV